MQIPWMVQIKRPILAICFLRTPSSFIKNQPIFWFESSLIGRQHEPSGAKKKLQLLKASNV